MVKVPSAIPNINVPQTIPIAQPIVTKALPVYSKSVQSSLKGVLSLLQKNYVDAKNLYKNTGAKLLTNALYRHQIQNKKIALLKKQVKGFHTFANNLEKKINNLKTPRLSKYRQKLPI